MKRETREFIRRAAFTACLAFTLITFFYLFVAALNDAAAKFEFFVFARYMLGKIGCIFLFSLCLGFINRIPEGKLPRATARLIHFFASLAAFVLFMIVLFYTGFEGVEALTVPKALFNLVLFLAGYFLVLGVCALGRKLFCKDEKKPYKSILD